MTARANSLRQTKQGSCIERGNLIHHSTQPYSRYVSHISVHTADNIFEKADCKRQTGCMMHQGLKTWRARYLQAQCVDLLKVLYIQLQDIDNRSPHAPVTKIVTIQTTRKPTKGTALACRLRALVSICSTSNLR